MNWKDQIDEKHTGQTGFFKKIEMETKTKQMNTFRIGNSLLFQGTADQAKAYHKLFFDVERAQMKRIQLPSVNDIKLEYNYDNDEMLVLTLYSDNTFSSHAVIVLKDGKWYLTDDNFLDSELIDEEMLMNIPAFKEAAICNQCDNTGYYIATNGNDPYDRGTPTECDCQEVNKEIQKYFK